MAKRLRKWLSGLVDWFRSPVVGAWLALLLTLDGCCLPRSTDVGLFLHPRTDRTGCRFDLLTFVVWRERGKLVLVEQRPEMEPEPPVPASEVGFVFFAPAIRSESGFWAPTRRSWGYQLDIDIAGATAEEQNDLRLELADRLADARNGLLAWQAPMVRAGRAPEPEVLRSGFVHNGISFVMFVGLVVSLSSIRSWPVFVAERERKWRRDVAAGKCPGCGYDVRGLKEGCCPECGAAW